MVIGAGVVGLAVARAMAQSGREVLVLEAAEAMGTGISARSSEVIHAGIYYPPGSAKAQLCLEGRRRLYAYCAEHGVQHRRCGKLVVATDAAQIPQLRAIEATARRNGVGELRWLEPGEAGTFEPALRCVAALLSPSTGIIDSHGLMLSLMADIERAGGALVCRTPVIAGRRDERCLVLEAGSEAQPMTLAADIVVNCAGLNAQDVARRLGVPQGCIPPLHYAKGNYFTLHGGSPFSHLVYPLPEPGGLGVHLTLDLSGRARFGPDVEWIERIDYTVDPQRAEPFYASIRRYWPALPDRSLSPAYAGIRPKLAGPGAPSADFLIHGPQHHGVPGLISLYGIESPGLTAALAIAQAVAERLQSIR